MTSGAPGFGTYRQGPAGPRAGTRTPPGGSVDERSLAGSLALLLRAYRQPILVGVGLLAASVALGLLLQEILATYGDLGVPALLALLVVAIGGVGVALFVTPGPMILGCAAVAFSYSSAALHDFYRLPLPLKYLPPLLLCAAAIQLIRQSRSALLPRALWLEPHPVAAAPVAFPFCVSLLGAYLVFTIVPLLYAGSQSLAFEELDTQWRNLMLGLALALTVDRFGRWSSLENVCTVALYAVTAVVLAAAAGSFVPGLDDVLPGFASIYDGGGDEETGVRIAGAYGHPNSLGRYAVFMVPFAVWRISVTHALQRALGVFCLVVLIAGVTLSESRGALLVLATITLPAAALMVRVVKVRHWLPGLLVGALVIMFSWQFVDTERMARTVDDFVRFVESGEAPSDGATRGRLSEMRIAFELWSMHPLLGVGLGNYEHYFQFHSYDFGTKLYNADRAAHSLYLELLAERGIVGLLGYLIAIGGIVLTVLLCAIARLRAGETVEGRLMIAMVVAMVAYYLGAVMLHDVHSSPVWALIGVMIASTRAGHPVPPSFATGGVRVVRTRGS